MGLVAALFPQKGRRKLYSIFEFLECENIAILWELPRCNFRKILWNSIQPIYFFYLRVYQGEYLKKDPGTNTACQSPIIKTVFIPLQTGSTFSVSLNWSRNYIYFLPKCKRRLDSAFVDLLRKICHQNYIKMNGLRHMCQFLKLFLVFCILIKSSIFQRKLWSFGGTFDNFLEKGGVWSPPPPQKKIKKTFSKTLFSFIWA